MSINPYYVRLQPVLRYSKSCKMKYGENWGCEMNAREIEQLDLLWHKTQAGPVQGEILH